MKKLLLSTSAALLLASNAYAGGFSFEGATLEATAYFYVPDGNEWQNYQLEGRVHANFGDHIGAQVDLGSAWYNGDQAFDAMNYGLHVFYNVNEKVKIGAFAGRSSWSGLSWEDYYGAEGRFDNGTIAVQAYAGIVAYAGDPSPGHSIYGIRGDYAIGPIGSIGEASVSARTDFFNYGNDTNDMIAYAVGGALHLNNGAYVEIEVGQTGRIESTMYPRVSVALGWNFGNGTPFERRDYYQVWQGY